MKYFSVILYVCHLKSLFLSLYTSIYMTIRLITLSGATALSLGNAVLQHYCYRNLLHVNGNLA